MKWLDCCKYCCNKCACAISDLLWVLWVSTHERYGRVLGEFRFHCFEEPPYWFLQWLEPIYIPTSGIQGFPSPTSSPASVAHFLNDGFLTAERQNISAVWISRVVKNAEKFLYFLFIYITILRQCLAVPHWMASDSQGSAARVSRTLLWSKVRITAPEILKYFYRSFLFVCFHLSRTISLSDSEDFGL